MLWSHPVNSIRACFSLVEQGVNAIVLKVTESIVTFLRKLGSELIRYVRRERGETIPGHNDCEYRDCFDKRL